MVKIVAVRQPLERPDEPRAHFPTGERSASQTRPSKSCVSRFRCPPPSWSGKKRGIDGFIRKRLEEGYERGAFLLGQHERHEDAALVVARQTHAFKP